MEEHPPARGAGVDALVQRDKVGIVDPEEIAEVLHLAEVAGEAGQLAEQERLDVPALHVGHHALGLGMLHDRFAGLARKVIDLDDVPTTGGGIHLGAFQMMLWRFAFGLLLGADANPDADIAGIRRERVN